MLDERNYTKKEYILYDSTFINSRKCKLIYSDRKEISGGLGTMGMRRREREG